MVQYVIPGQKLTGTTSFDAGDALVNYPADGSPAKKIEFQNFVNSISGEINGGYTKNLGWEFFFDTQYFDEANGFDITAGEWTRIPNNQGFILPQATNLPEGVSSFYDVANQKLLFDSDSAWYSVVPAFAIVPAAANSSLQMRGLVDSSPTPGPFYGPKDISIKGDAGVVTVVTETSSFMSTGSVAENGVFYELNCSADATLYSFAYLIGKQVQK